MLNRNRTSWVMAAAVLGLICAWFLAACGRPGGVSLEELARLVQSGQTAPERASIAC